MRVVVTGLIGSIPMAGLTLHYLQYVLGLRKLGYEVLYLEDTGSWYYDAKTDSMVDDVNLPLKHLSAVMNTYSLTGNWGFIDLDGALHGISEHDFNEFVQTSELLVNVTGAGIIRESYLKIPNRVYVDTDPGYIQMRVSRGSRKDLKHLQRHNAHFSFGCNIGKPSCGIPTCGFDWHPTVQPLILDLWPLIPPPPAKSEFTTILKWQTYEPIEHEGKVYGLKNMEFLKFLELPSLAGQKFEIAMAGDPPTQDLQCSGWKCRAARSVSTTIKQYQEYIRSSRAEWSIAKNGYVETNSGWFSDRSAAYLATGRPVILQSTGYGEWLETGQGVLSFSTLEEACEAVDAIDKDYQFHCSGARALAEKYFDSDKVLESVISKIFD